MTLARAPSSRPTLIVLGPRNTIIVGYASGDLGLWEARRGKRLAHARLHGAVIHALLENRKLYVATELGRTLIWDLGAFYLDECQLLHQVWERIAVVWEDGQPAEKPPPSDHHCLLAD